MPAPRRPLGSTLRQQFGASSSRGSWAQSVSFWRPRRRRQWRTRPRADSRRPARLHARDRFGSARGVFPPGFRGLPPPQTPAGRGLPPSDPGRRLGCFGRPLLTPPGDGVAGRLPLRATRPSHARAINPSGVKTSCRRMCWKFTGSSAE